MSWFTTPDAPICSPACPLQTLNELCRAAAACTVARVTVKAEPTAGAILGTGHSTGAQVMAAEAVLAAGGMAGAAVTGPGAADCPICLSSNEDDDMDDESEDSL